MEYNAATGTMTKKVGFTSGGLAYPYGDLTYLVYKFYGTVATGGTLGCGVIFEYDPFTKW